MEADPLGKKEDQDAVRGQEMTVYSVRFYFYCTFPGGMIK